MGTEEGKRKIERRHKAGKLHRDRNQFGKRIRFDFGGKRIIVYISSDY